MYRLRSKISCLVILGALISCRKDEVRIPESNNFPSGVAAIINTSCNTSGCHTTQSKEAAGGISMSSWEELMMGGNNGNAYVIPYSPDQSPFLYVVNTYEEYGPTLNPQMPYNQPALSKKEVGILYTWIANGAPSEAGEIAFTPLADRPIIYVLNATCNKIAEIDAISGLVMRYVDINEGGGNFVEIIKAAPNGQHFYAVHNDGILKKFNTNDNTKVGQLNLGSGFWRSMSITSDSKLGFVTNWSGNSDYNGGQIAVVNLDQMNITAVYDNPVDSLYFPHGITLNQSNTLAYVSCQTGNFIWKIDISAPTNPTFSKILLEPGESTAYQSSPYRPGNIFLSPNESTYFVICEKSAEIRVFDQASDVLLGTNSVGKNPQHLAYSTLHNLYAVTCMEDQSSFPEGKGSVVIFDATSHTEITRLYTGYQPKGIVTDKTGNYMYVIHRNADPVGADAPHHYTDCEGNNGYATIIDLNTLQLLPDYKAELNVDPYSAAIKL